MAAAGKKAASKDAAEVVDTAGEEPRYRIKLGRAVPYEGVILSPKDTHTVTASVKKQLGDAVIDAEPV